MTMTLKPCRKCGIPVWILISKTQKGLCYVCLSKIKPRIKKEKINYSNMFFTKY